MTSPRRSFVRRLLVPAVLASAVLGSVLWLLEIGWLVTQGVGTLVIAMLLASVTTIPYTAIVLWVDRHEKEPPWLIAASFAWGALACTALSGVVNALAAAVLGALFGDTQIGWALSVTVVAPVFEELTKAGALVVLFTRFRHHTDGILDGMVYGAIVGMGFAWFENTLYYIRASTDGVAAVLTLTWARGVLSGVGTHATFTALTGMGFGVHRAMRQGRARDAAPLVGLTAAMGAHGLWNTGSGWFLSMSDVPARMWMVQAPMAVVALQLPFMLLVMTVALLTLRHQDTLIRTYLLEEPPDIVTAADVERMVPARRRFLSGLKATLEGGPRGWWRHRQLTQALVRIAFDRWHHTGDQAPGDPELDALREVVRRLRHQGVSV